MPNPNGKTPEERLDALELRTNALSDAMIVQGYLQGRTERNVAELTDDVRELSNAVGVLADNQAKIQGVLQTVIEQVQTLSDSMQNLADNQSSVQAALQGLTEQIDRFLRGQQKNGHGPTQ
jgi:translation initiation factor 2B subunit (eIF-2B alpha/beta/delta family)